jgi:hypothetical protein
MQWKIAIWNTSTALTSIFFNSLWNVLQKETLRHKQE